MLRWFRKRFFDPGEKEKLSEESDLLDEAAKTIQHEEYLKGAYAELGLPDASSFDSRAEAQDTHHGIKRSGSVSLSPELEARLNHIKTRWQKTRVWDNADTRQLESLLRTLEEQGLLRIGDELLRQMLILRHDDDLLLQYATRELERGHFNLAEPALEHLLVGAEAPQEIEELLTKVYLRQGKMLKLRLLVEKILAHDFASQHAQQIWREHFEGSDHKVRSAAHSALHG